jgi:hypothetical protein
MNSALRKLDLTWMLLASLVGHSSLCGYFIMGHWYCIPLCRALQPKPVAFTAPSAQYDLSQSRTIEAVLNQHGIIHFNHISHSVLRQ